MKYRKLAALALTGLLLAGCGGGSSNAHYINSGVQHGCTDHNLCQLHSAVQAFSDAYLTGKPLASYNLLSERCRARVSLSRWTRIVTAADREYGSQLQIKTFRPEVEGNMARVTYTFSVTAINQSHEPWVKEAGQWHEDDC